MCELRPLWVNGLVKKVQNRTIKDLHKSFSPLASKKSTAYKLIVADIGLICFKFSRGRDCSPDLYVLVVYANSAFIVIVIFKRQIYSTLSSI